MIIADRERQRGGERDQRQRADPAPGAGAETAVTCGGGVLRHGEAFAHRHTRRTIAVPNKPFGRNTSTSMISASATVSLSWLAIK